MPGLYFESHYALDSASGGAALGGMYIVGVAATSTTVYRPSSVDAQGNWTAVGQATIPEAIDEVEASDADYAISGTSPSHDILRVNFGSVVAPPVRTDHVMRYRLSADGLVNAVVRWKAGANTIATRTHSPVPQTPTTFTIALTPAEAASINANDYPNSRIEVEAGT